MKRISRRIFTEEFKKEAVRLVQSEGLTIAEAARKLDVAPKSLKTWIALHQQGALKGSLGVAKLRAEQLRIRELERELAIAREERDILKKPPRTPYRSTGHALRNCRSKVRHDYQTKSATQHPPALPNAECGAKRLPKLAQRQNQRTTQTGRRSLHLAHSNCPCTRPWHLRRTQNSGRVT